MSNNENIDVFLNFANDKINPILQYIDENNIDKFNKDQTNIPGGVSEEIISYSEKFLEPIVSLVDELSNPELRTILYENIINYNQIIKAKFEYIQTLNNELENSQDEAKLDNLNNLLEGWIIDYYNYVEARNDHSKLETTYETTIAALDNIRKGALTEGGKRGLQKGGGLFKYIASLISGALFVSAGENNQLAVPTDSNLNTRQFEQNQALNELIVPNTPYTRQATLGFSVEEKSAFTNFFFGDDSEKINNDLQKTTNNLNELNNEICVGAINKLNDEFVTHKEAVTLYDNEDVKEVLTEAVKSSNNILKDVGVVVQENIEAGLFTSAKTIQSQMTIHEGEQEQKIDIKPTEIKEVIDRAVDPQTVFTPQQALIAERQIVQGINNIIVSKKQQVRQQSAFEKAQKKQKLFELSHLCNENLLNPNITIGKYELLIDLKSHAFKNAMYENLIENYESSSEKTPSKDIQIEKIKELLELLNPTKFMVKIKVFSEKKLVSNCAKIALNNILIDYVEYLKIIHTHDNPTEILAERADIKRAAKEAEERRLQESFEAEQKKVQTQFDIELQENQTSVEQNISESKVKARNAAANQTKNSMKALSEYVTSYVVGTSDIVLNPVTGLAEDIVGKGVDVTYNSMYKIFIGLIPVISMAGIVIVSVMGITTCMCNYALIQGLIGKVFRKKVKNYEDSLTTATAQPATAQPARARNTRFNLTPFDMLKQQVNQIHGPGAYSDEDLMEYLQRSNNDFREALSYIDWDVRRRNRGGKKRLTRAKKYNKKNKITKKRNRRNRINKILINNTHKRVRKYTKNTKKIKKK